MTKKIRILILGGVYSGVNDFPLLSTIGFSLNPFFKHSFEHDQKEVEENESVDVSEQTCDNRAIK